MSNEVPNYRTPEGWAACRSACFQMYRIFRRFGSKASRSREEVRAVIVPILQHIGPRPVPEEGTP